MALTVHGTSSANSSSSIPKWNFHVFLSFRGEDTRKSFTDHLYAALCRKGIKAFRDDEELKRGEVISDKLLQAIEGSLFAIVVISKNYASSSWCLIELQKIIDSKKEVGQQVFPIFYGVNPSDVRHQKGSFAQAFIEHEEKFKEDQEKVQKWKDSLTEVANLSGWDSKEWPESKLIEKVVEALWSNLRFKLPPYDAKLVGIDPKIDAIESLLGIGLDDIRFVGIWGMGGVGKTTLARVVYDRLLDQFEICCFLNNVKEVSERDEGHIHLQEKIVSHLKVKGMTIEDTYEGRKKIRNLCCNKKVLLVLDDVSSICQLENLAESQEWFGAGSRVIITTRNSHLLRSHGVHEIYKVETLNEQESLQLFSRKAFRRDQPKEDYVALSKTVIKYVGGLPLALKVLGSFLCGRSVPEWEDTLDVLKLDPNTDIHKILRISYDGLNDFEKKIFLDIACFFESRDNKDKVTQILKFCGLQPTIGIRLLVEKSLLSETVISGCTYINMHDLIQEMGKSIVFQESPNNPGKRSRLWSPKDIDIVLKKNLGTEMTQGIVLPFNSHETYCNREAFSNMINLRLLMIRSNLKLAHSLKCLSSGLRVLQWNAYPLEDLPLGTQLDELAYLQMCHSKIKQLWDGTQCFENLKFMDLSHSIYLLKTPNFVGVKNLERLILVDCFGLVEVHPSLGQLKNLLEVNLKGCKKLKALPRKFEMDSLKEFTLSGCTQVKNLPEFGENMKNLETLDLQETGIAKLPESLGFLTSMKVLNLKGCKNLVCLPHTIQNLKHLKNLHISGCPNFSKLPEKLNENEALEELDASETAITEVPSFISQLEKLKVLSFGRCKEPASNSLWYLPSPLNKIFQRHPFPKGLILPPSIFNLKLLRKLSLSYCNIGEGFIPDDLSSMSSLWELDLSGNNFANLPAACIYNLLQLQSFQLHSCPRLQSLPLPPPSLFSFTAYECPSMEHISDQTLCHMFASFYRGSQVNAEYGELSVTSPWNEIPSWFKNQINISLDEDETKYPDGLYHRGLLEIGNPSSEWLGYALCLMVQAKPKGSCLLNCRWGLYEIVPGYWDHIGGRDKHEPMVDTWILFRKPNRNLSLELYRLWFQFDAFNLKEWEETYSIKCGWRFIYKEDLEGWGKTMSGSQFSILEEDKDGGNGMCCDAEMQGQCSLSVIDSSQTISPELSSSCLEEESQLRYASRGNKGEDKGISDLNSKRKGEFVLCKSDQDNELSSSFGPPNKKSKNADSEMMVYLKGKGKEPSH